MKDKRYDFNPFAGTLFDNQHAYADRDEDVSGPARRNRHPNPFDFLGTPPSPQLCLP